MGDTPCRKTIITIYISKTKKYEGISEYVFYRVILHFVGQMLQCSETRTKIMKSHIVLQIKYGGEKQRV